MYVIQVKKKKDRDCSALSHWTCSSRQLAPVPSAYTQSATGSQESVDHVPVDTQTASGNTSIHGFKAQ